MSSREAVLALGALESRGKCPACGEDSLVAAPVTVLTAEGVAPLSDYIVCGRCGQ